LYASTSQPPHAAATTADTLPCAPVRLSLHVRPSVRPFKEQSSNDKNEKKTKKDAAIFTS
jgi:hypothetical protein